MAEWQHPKVSECHIRNNGIAQKTIQVKNLALFFQDTSTMPISENGLF